MNRITTLKCAIISLALTGCVAVSSSTGEGNGLIYYLPKTVISLQLTVGSVGSDVKNNQQSRNISLTCIPDIIADRDGPRFVLNSSANEFFSRNHKLEVKEGLLSTVDLSDDGRISEIIKDLGETVTNIIAANMNPVSTLPGGITSGGTEADNDKTLSDLYAIEPQLPQIDPFPTLEIVSDPGGSPTAEEISQVLLELPAGDNTWIINSSSGFLEIPGCEGRVRVTFNIGGSFPSDKSPNSTSMTLETGKSSDKILGIATKSLSKEKISTQIKTDAGYIEKFRFKAAERNIDKIANYIQKIKITQKYYQDKSNFIVEHKALSPAFRKTEAGVFKGDTEGNEKIAQLARLVDYANSIISEKISYAEVKRKDEVAKRDSFKRNITSHKNIDITLQSQDLLINTTIDEKIVVIPLSRSPVGQTTQKVTLAQGIVTNFDSNKPSAVEGLISIPIELAKQIIGIPAAAFARQKEKTTATDEIVKKQTELAKDQKALIDAQKALIDAQKEQSSDSP